MRLELNITIKTSWLSEINKVTDSSDISYNLPPMVIHQFTVKYHQALMFKIKMQ